MSKLLDLLTPSQTEISAYRALVQRLADDQKPLPSRDEIRATVWAASKTFPELEADIERLHQERQANELLREASELRPAVDAAVSAVEQARAKLMSVYEDGQAKLKAAEADLNEQTQQAEQLIGRAESLRSEAKHIRERATGMRADQQVDPADNELRQAARKVRAPLPTVSMRPMHSV